MGRTLAVLFAALLVSIPAVGQSPPPAVRWSAAACRGRGVYADSRDSEASVSDDGHVTVRVKDSAGALLGERTVDGPHWRTRFNDCQAMGIASTDFVRVHGRLAVRVEVSVGDLCDRGAPRCA